MSQLILAVLAIALTAASLAATINYLPWWLKSASDSDLLLRRGLPLLEKTYKAVTRANLGIAPAVTTAADGGFASNFQSVLLLPPAPPPGFSWSYGQHALDGSTWSGLHYFCLSQTGPADIADWKGFARAKQMFSSEQYVINASCGETVNMAEPVSFPADLALTFYVTFIPGIDDV